MLLKEGIQESQAERLIKVTRHNNGVHRKMVEKFKAENSTQVNLLRWGF